MRSPALLLTSLLCVVLLGSVAPTAAAPAASADETGRLVLVLDSSGSMKESAAGGGTKIAAAKAALRDVVTQLPDSAEVGLRVFGAKVFSREEAGACGDTQNVVPVGPLDRARLTSAVQDYKPYGETPIGTALQGAARDLGPARAGEKRTIVLLSDGEPTCAPDPCTVARRLRDRGIDLRINVVGLDVSGKARRALQCAARAGGGRYFDAASAEELSQSLVQVSVRALRLFSLSGDAVTGGTTTADPTEVRPGDYLDESLPDRAPRFYLVDVPEGGAVSAAAVMRPGRSEKILDTVSVTLLTPDGDSCANDTSSGLNALGLTSIVGAAAYVGPLVSNARPPCTDAEQLLAQVTFNGPPTAYGLRIRAYPRVTNVDALPGAASKDDQASWERPVPLAGRSTPVVGGASFEDAPELRPGTTYADSLRPREQLIYKVEVGYGQSPRMTARLETDPQAARLQGVLGVQVTAKGFSPLGKELSLSSSSETGVRPSGRYNGDQPVTVAQAHPPVHYRNLESPDASISQVALDGYYYVTVEMGGDPNRAHENFQAPVRLAVAVDGQESGAPDYAGAVAGESASPAPEKVVDESESVESTAYLIPSWMFVLGGLLLLALVAGAIVAGVRAGRRRG